MGERPRTVAVVSSDEQEGKSTTALSLGRAAGELELRTLLVEADLRRPSLLGEDRRLGSRRRFGFSTVLVHRATLTEAIWTMPESNVDLLPAGPLPPNPAALLGSPGAARVRRGGQDRYDLVVYDTPPLSVSADASLVAAITDGVCSWSTTAPHQRARRPRRWTSSAARTRTILGVVVNRVDPAEYTSGYYAADPALVADSRAEEPSSVPPA